MQSEVEILDTAKVRSLFPILGQTVHGKPLVYFDNAATTQKPISVIQALEYYYSEINANIHRGLHTLADKATVAYEASRAELARFIGSPSVEQVIFTRGVTESINLVARSYGGMVLSKGDEVIISAMEHHSNIVPWQMICAEKGAVLRVIPIQDNGEILWDEFLKLLSPRTKIVSIVHVSNALGTINPVEQIIAEAHKIGAVVVVDGAQAASHLHLDMQALDVDFYALSAHKFYGPTGVGALYGKRELLESMPPYMGGGEMIREVTFENTTYNELPYKFEAGTPNIADTIALKYALDFISTMDKSLMAAHEEALLAYLLQRLTEVPGVHLYGTSSRKVSVQSFLLEGIHPQDVGIILDGEGIAVRTGHHCTQPLIHRLGVPGTVRVSFAVYNTFEEIDKLILALHKARKMLL